MAPSPAQTRLWPKQCKHLWGKAQASTHCSSCGGEESLVRREVVQVLCFHSADDEEMDVY